MNYTLYLHIHSDEGDTSSSDSSENELNILNSNEEGFCCQPVPLVPPSSPISPTKNRLNRRVNERQFHLHLINFKRFILQLTQSFQLQRTKGKAASRPTISQSLKKSHKYHRSAIDLPTAEPYLECTSDCEDYSEHRMTSAKNTFRLQIKSGQRVQTTTEKITANELVVIASQKSDLIKEQADSTKSVSEIKEKFNNIAVSELPAIKGSKRSAWQNMKKWVSIFGRLAI